MGVFEEIDKIPRQELASDMPSAFTATVLSARKTQGEYGFYLALELQTEDGATFTTTYHIPKKRTGKGQMDLLIDSCNKLNLQLRDIVGRTFQWKRVKLSGAMKGNARHYPVKMVKKLG